MAYRSVIILTTFIGGALLLAPWPPLGVSGEWVWPRHDLPASLFEGLDRLIWPLLCGGVIVAFFAWGMGQIDRVGKLRRGVLVLTLSSLGFVWLEAVRQAAPSPHRELRPIWVLYDRFASGYFFEATFHVTSTSQMLADYERRMAKGDVLHEGTHPPGLLLLNRGLLCLTASSPAVMRFSEALQNREMVRMFREVEATVRIARPLSRSEFAALHLSALLSTLFAALTVIPVYGLSKRLTDSRTAWYAATLMVTVPTIGVFVPRSDVLYACSGMLLVWAVVAAILTVSRRLRWSLAIVAGVILFCCLLLSLAHLPVLVMVAVFAVSYVLTDWNDRICRTIEAAIVTVASFVTACGLWNYGTHCNLIHVWRMNLTNHAGFYAQSPRTWSAWLVANPIELGMAVGLPMAAMAVVMLWQTCTGISTSRPDHLSNGRLFAVACALTWTILCLSGKNMGEAARLWCFVTPWIAITAAQVSVLNSNNFRRLWLLLVIAQLVLATITVGRVSGFLELASS